MASISDDPNVMAFADTRPPRAALVNITTNEQHDFLFNPETLEERIEAKYNRVSILGLSHERLSFKNTGNTTVPIRLYLSQLYQDHLSGRPDSTPPIRQQKAWLQSLVYPASSEDFGYVGATQVLFVWPRVLRMIGRITRVSFLHRRFRSKDLSSVEIVASLEFEEDVEQRRLMEDVQLMGSLVADEDL